MIIFYAYFLFIFDMLPALKDKEKVNLFEKT
ncbi:hypothetical protein SODG_006297 [Sodalis praecaptivus]